MNQKRFSLWSAFSPEIIHPTSCHNLVETLQQSGVLALNVTLTLQLPLGLLQFNGDMRLDSRSMIVNGRASTMHFASMCLESFLSPRMVKDFFLFREHWSSSRRERVACSAIKLRLFGVPKKCLVNVLEVTLTMYGIWCC